MRKCRKMISVIMLMVMLVSLLPSGALAAEAPTGATNEVAAVEEPTEVEPATGETEETLPVESKTDGTENEDNNETSNTEGTSEGAPVSDDNEKDPAEDGTIGTAKSEEPTEGNAENAGLGETSTEIAAAVEPVDETVNKEAKAATSYEYEIKLGDSVSVKDLAVKAGLVTEEEAAEFAAGIAAVEFSNECVTVTHDSDWMLECVKVFQTPENLTITMADGTVHTVSVTCGTDAQVEFLDADWAYISEFGLNTEEGIIDGTIDCIATDHAPHSAEEKSRGLEKSAFGIVGIETAFPLLYTYLVIPGIISMEKLEELLVYNPRRRFGIPLGNDYSVWDLGVEWTITPDLDFLSKGKATPFEGWRVSGINVLTVCDGKPAYIHR